MNIATTNAIAKVAAVVAGAGLVLSSFAFAVPAKADTTSDLQAQIAALLAQVSALQAQLGTSGGTSTSGGTTFTMDLTIGSTGAEVTALQNWLIGEGYQIPAGATGYFGAQTQAALAAYQANKGISPAVGYFGPITRAAVNAQAGTGTGTGTGSDDDDDVDFSGDGEGYLDEFEAISSYNNEEVGEDEEDVGVLGVEMEASDADQKIERVTVIVDTPTSGDDLEDFITEVSLWLDGEELDRMDVDDASHDQGDDEYTFRFTSLDGVISEGEMGELVVAVTGAGNLDSSDVNSGWTVEIPADGIRAVSPNGVDDTYDGSAFSETFTVDTFASAAGVELSARSSDDTPEGVVNVDATDDTDGVELFRFFLEAEGGDITIDELPVTFATSSTNTGTLATIASTVTLEIDGEEYSENTSTAAGSGTSATVTFDDLDLTIGEGDEVEVVVKADLNDTEAAVFVDGDDLTGSYTASNRALTEAEDETGEDLAESDKSGTATGEAIAFYDVGIMVAFVSAEETLTVGADGTADDDTVTLEMVFSVEAFDGTVYVSNNATPTTAADLGVSAIDVDDGGILYRYEIDGTATVGLLADVVSIDDTSGDVADQQASGGDGGEYTFEEGEAGELTVTVTRSNATTHTDSDGFHDMQLVAIGWSTTNEDDTMNVYEFDLEDFNTDPLFAN